MQLLHRSIVNEQYNCRAFFFVWDNLEWQSDNKIFAVCN